MAIEREMAISYGNIRIGGNSRFYKIDEVHSLSLGYEENTVEFTFVVVGTSNDEFVAAVQAAEIAFRIPNQTCQIIQASSSLKKWSHEKSTGFNGRPEIIKAGGPKDTGRSRSYRVRLTFGMPADTGGEESVGLREATIDVAKSPSKRRTVSFSGTYTAVGTTGARAQYEAKASTYCLSVLAGIGGTYELTEEAQVETDEHDKVCQWVREYEELIFAQSSGATDDADIVRQELRIERRRMAPGDTQALGGSAGSNAPNIPAGGAAGGGTSTLSGTARLVEVTARYDAWLDSSRTTDIIAKYDASLKSWITDQARGTQSGTFALVNESVEPLYDDNRISVTLQFEVLTQGETGVLERSVTVRDNQDSGRKFVGLWTGDPLSAYTYQAHTIVLRTISLVELVPGAKSVSEAMKDGLAAADAARGTPPNINPGSGGEFIEVSRDADATVKFRGLDGEGFSTTEIRATIVMRRVKTPSSTGGGGNTGGSSGGTATEPSIPSDDYLVGRRR